jgi:hypothetical protein
MAAAAAGDRPAHARAFRLARRSCVGLVLVTACCAPGHSRSVPPVPSLDVKTAPARPDDDPLAALRSWETAARARTDFARARTSDVALGTDPYVIRRVAKGDGAAAADRFVGILRGRSVVVELDGELREVRRFAAPASPTGLAVAQSGDLFAVGELSNRVARFRNVGGRLEPAGFIELSGVRAIRDVATGPEGVVYVVEEHDGRLLTFYPGTGDGSAPSIRADDVICHGPLHVQRVGRSVVVDCLLDHQIVVRSVDARGFPERDGEVRITRDGPIWGIDAVALETGLLVAVGGVEDHPLDRTEGSFGFIDSFVATYSVTNGAATKLSEVNTSEHGVVTPKALKLSRLPTGAIDLVVAGYGSDRLAIVEWADPTTRTPPTVRTRAIPPGSAMIEGAGDGSWIVANPLLDAWVRVTATDSTVVAVEDEVARTRTVDSRLGEALFFTTLMAPWNRSDGRLSRFTCETCHFEGYVDGRTHRTGRGDIVATTKPLVGLFNNRPHFSRALDPDLATMVHNEFRVAGANSDHDPWFSISVSEFPWIRFVGVPESTLGPEALRRSLMSFFMNFAPRPNPAVIGREHWSDVERAGAYVFRSKCESCHQARFVTDDPSTRIPFEGWEDLVMAPEGAIVWADAEYEKTGVTPYVNEHGARVVSLRRLYKKYPYFTNGAAKSLGAVLDRAAFDEGHFFHDGAPDGATGLSADEKAQLTAFLDLL